MKIYTKTGDKGTTGLFGGQRVPKHDIRIEAYGTVDELNSVIGIVLTHETPANLREHLQELSALLFTVGSDLATPLDPPPVYEIPRVQEYHIEWLESLIDSYDAELEPLKTFILPGGTPAAAALHLARTVCRRAERVTTSLAGREDIGDCVVRFLNRCSDYLFTAARYANRSAGIEDVPWKPHR
ncbi:MAG: cob(I)yrinic acid a,c-diamide adenosyltransferase [Candidatus Kapabacteria bacterium]|nr:cob(I)yrinic acid a,c-diamide adenosyltransferase [Candidatus Kapabacteria bacterium]